MKNSITKNDTNRPILMNPEQVKELTLKTTHLPHNNHSQKCIFLLNGFSAF